ncbi:MAG: hypothetical protein ACNA7U_08860 [Candidatus Izemoplasmataceae bacterium]|jgi:hypothetical protein
MIKQRKNVMIYGALLSVYVVIFLGYFMLTEYDIIEFSRTVFYILLTFFIIDTAFVVYLVLRVPKHERLAAYERYQFHKELDPKTDTFHSYHSEDEVTFYKDKVYSKLHNRFFRYDEITMHAFLVKNIPYEVINIFIELDYHEINTKDNYTHVNFDLTEDLFLIIKAYSLEVACLDEIIENLEHTLKIKQ